MAAPSGCGSVTVDGKTRYFSSNASVVTGIEAVATVAFAPFFGTLMLFVTLLFAWISFKTDGALHWITLIISLISLWTTGKTVYKRYKAKKFLDENLKDTCDAPPPVPVVINPAPSSP
jgi:membrane protein implicated in regulation of membrane protease activity